MKLSDRGNFRLETQTKTFSVLLLRRDLPMRRDCLLLLLFWLHLRRMGAAVRDIMPQRSSQLLAVVGKDFRVETLGDRRNVPDNLQASAPGLDRDA